MIVRRASRFAVAIAIVASSAACKSSGATSNEGADATERSAADSVTAEEDGAPSEEQEGTMEPREIVGETSADEIVAAQPTWGEMAKAHEPDSEAIATLEGADDVRIAIWLGTWCGDSRREVSRWIAAQRAIEEGPKIEYYAVDRSMSAPDLEVPDSLTNVPTFYVYRGDEELGRVVETAVEPIEADIADLVSGERSGFVSASVEPPIE